MAKNTAPQLRNGFPLVNRMDLQSHCHISMDHAESMMALFAAIIKLAADTPEIQGLAKHGKDLADSLHNDINCVREQATEAGLEGYLVPERVPMSDSPEFLAGATAGFSALQTIEGIVDRYHNEAVDSESYFRDRELIKAAVVNHIGPVSPFVHGFVSVLAEWIDNVMQDGSQPNLNRWKPESMMSEREIKDYRSALFEHSIPENEEQTEAPRAEKALPPIPPRRYSYKSDDPCPGLCESKWLPFQTLENPWNVPPIDDARHAELMGMEYAAHYAQQLKDIPDYVSQGGLGHIAQAINFSDKSDAESYWIAFFTRMDYYIHRGVKRLDIWKDLDQRIEYEERLFAESDREDAALEAASI